MGLRSPGFGAKHQGSIKSGFARIASLKWGMASAALL
jgi:hypothetical protein